MDGIVTADQLQKLINNLPNLQFFRLNECSALKDSDFSCFEQSTKLSEVQLVDCPQITGIGFSHFRKLSSLKVCVIKSCGLTEEGLMAIGKVSSLRELIFHDCPITRQSLLRLQHLKLDAFYIDCEGITEEDLVKLGDSIVSASHPCQ